MSDEILAAFAAESAELLESIEEAVNEYQAGTEGALDTLFRNVHTLKGSAGIVGLERLEAFSHLWESSLGRMRQMGYKPGPECAGTLLACRGHAMKLLAEGQPAIGAEGAPERGFLEPADRAVVAALDAIIEGPSFEAAPEAGVEPARPSGPDVPQGQPQPLRERRTSETDRRHPVQASGDTVARITGAKLERILSLSSEVVVALSNLGQSARACGQLVDEVSVIESLAAALYKSVLETRMVPFGEVASRYLRAVEDIARETGKKIRFALAGADTEIDKSLGDRLAEPLLHLVRNAADHGIEDSAVRIAAGKSAEGVVALRASRESGLLTLRIEDDGKGIDPEAIRTRAIETGRIGADEKLEEDDLFDLLFEPGFTLSSKVTKWSGRGVGLDVVKKGVIALRGTVRMESVEGKGTATIVRLPLALSLVEGFVARVGGLKLLVPYDVASSCVEFQDDGRELGLFRTVPLDGRLLPSIDLRSYYGEGAGEGRRVVIVLEEGGRSTGLVVDEVGETLSVAVRPLDRRVAESPGIAGSAVLGDGSMVLVLDTAELGRMAAKAAKRI